MKHFKDLFPGLRGTTWRVTSPAQERYNCIAWAAGVTDAWWWPVGDPAWSTWPEGAPPLETIAAFRDAFAKLGYEVSADGEREAGQEKVAVFADPDGCPTHAARQLSDGRWTSKLGRREDIEHGLRDLEGVEYGAVVLFLKRPLRAAGGAAAKEASHSESATAKAASEPAASLPASPPPQAESAELKDGK
jgi:hypothetical protein